MVKPQLSDAIRLIRSLPLTELLKVAEGGLRIGYLNSEFQLIGAEIECEVELFHGGKYWLESHVPDDELGTEKIRGYLIAYLKDMYKYITEDWEYS